MPVNGISMPAIIIVIQVIFGSPLKREKEFRSDDVAKLVRGTLGTANHIRILNKLVDLEWLSAQPGAPLARGGRPSITVYTRTRTGNDGYKQLVKELRRFGIMLSH